ncbi:MAG: GNAT family N-acetyltransferase [Christensenellaceae bacterium]
MEYEGKPIGFCQYYDYKNGGESWHGDTEIEGAYSIDYMIGETEFLRKGYGKLIINALIEKIKAHGNAIRIIVQPEQENKASCGTLLSCGFTYDEKNEIYIMNV